MRTTRRCNPAYRTVTLTNLDGSGYLQGDWANVRSNTGKAAFSSTNSFLYTRDDDRFEQVMAYYWVTTAQTDIQSLGFGLARRPVNEQSQDIRIDQIGIDNSYSWDKHDVVRFGKGGVDDAEDAEVILHEYGHAIQEWQQPDGTFGTSAEAGSIGEGFGDYWAATVSNVFASRALWDIRGALGHVKADTRILEAQFSFAPDTSMPAAASATVAAARSLYGNSAANATRGAFEDRGIL